MSPQLVHRTIALYFAATRAMDRDAWVATFSEDAVSHDPVDGPPIRGREALGKFFDGIVGLARSIGLSEEDVFICGGQAAVKWTGRGVGKNGKPLIFEGIDIFEFDSSGRIRQLHAYWNPAKLMKQLE